MNFYVDSGKKNYLFPLNVYEMWKLSSTSVQNVTLFYKFLVKFLRHKDLVNHFWFVNKIFSSVFICYLNSPISPFIYRPFRSTLNESEVFSPSNKQMSRDLMVFLMSTFYHGTGCLIRSKSFRDKKHLRKSQFVTASHPKKCLTSFDKRCSFFIPTFTTAYYK